jgi:hypothetical protein
MISISRADDLDDRPVWFVTLRGWFQISIDTKPVDRLLPEVIFSWLR